MSDVDIIVVGGGIVGASFALLMRDSGAEVTIIEPNTPAAFSAGDEFDHRVYALTPGNINLLDGLNVFHSEDLARLSPIRNMQISANRNGKLNFSARDANLSELAKIVEHRLLAARLQEQLKRAQHVRISTAKLTKVQKDDKQVMVSSDDGQEWRAPLLVGADGSESWVRNECGFALKVKDYDQLGLVANFHCQLAHGDTALQWFQRDGVLAWLPLPKQCISIVWSVNVERGAALLSMSATEFCDAVRDAGGNELGTLQLLSPVAKFPLRWQRSEPVVQGRVVLIGDAAHSVHPLAGQGLNLGLQDAKVLAHTLCNKRVPEGFGDHSVLRRYERARKQPVAAMQSVTDGLQRLFASESTILSTLRNNGLALTDRAGWLKRLLIREAVG